MTIVKLILTIELGLLGISILFTPIDFLFIPYQAQQLRLAAHLLDPPNQSSLPHQPLAVSA
jgi:hypothetical protein